MKTKVYLCSMELPDGAAVDIDGLSRMLSEGRQEKIRSRRFPKDKLQALGAGLLLDHGLREYGLRERDVRMAYGDNGKPYLVDYPGLHFNLSHSGTMVMAVFSDCPAGCDVEQVQAARMGVAQRFFAEPELKMLTELSSGERQDELFFRLWTLKESYLKATGEGMRMALDSFVFSLEGGAPKVYAAGKGVPEEFAFHEFSVPGYSAAACLKGGEEAGAGDIFFSFQNLTDVVRCLCGQ